MRKVYIIVCILCGIACNNSDPGNQISSSRGSDDEVTSNAANPSLVDDWTGYLQSSDSGLWEDSTEYSKNLTYLRDMYTEDAIAVYSPYAVKSLEWCKSVLTTQTSSPPFPACNPA